MRRIAWGLQRCDPKSSRLFGQAMPPTEAIIKLLRKPMVKPSKSMAPKPSAGLALVRKP